jgi:hypothetical protein
VLGSIYGDASHRNNGFIWDKIRAYVDTGSDAFCCLGDLNAISNMEEKFGGSRTFNSNNKSFRDLIQQTDLLDLGYKGPAYT